MSETTEIPESGQWVKVWAQVKDNDPHPEDYIVTLFSHNEEYDAYVRRDRVFITNVVPEWAERCRALTYYEGAGALYRCERPQGHAGDHEDVDGDPFNDDGVIGYFEEKE